MRTKTLLLTAALGLAGIASSMAQVYSVNAVGYVNISIPVVPADLLTYRIIANPLNGTNNNLSTVIPTVPDGSQLYFFRSGTFEIYTYLGGWITDTTWNPGEAAFIEIPQGAPNPTTITFVGEVPQGHLVNHLPAGPSAGVSGYSLRASIVPQAGALQTVLGLTPQDGDQVYQFNGTYNISTFLGGWVGTEPTVAVGEGFFYENNGAAFDWVRDFTVSP